VPAGRDIALIMPPPELWAGALSLLLIHGESGCPHSALNAARLLDRLCDSPDIDDETRGLCERASSRLTASPSLWSGNPPLRCSVRAAG
jgi:hypothetical protein